MTMIRIHKQVVFECDGCGDTFDAGTSDFDDAYHAAKQEGWVAFNNDGDWEHRCEDCKGKD
jgi:hypothetical protein